MAFQRRQLCEVAEFIARPLVAAANKDENFYLNYKEASGIKRRSQISAGG